jgi:hypothetical protein
MFIKCQKISMAWHRSSKKDAVWKAIRDKTKRKTKNEMAG